MKKMFRKLVTLIVMLGILMVMFSVLVNGSPQLVWAKEGLRKIANEGKTFLSSEVAKLKERDNAVPTPIFTKDPPVEIDWGNGTIRVTGRGALPPDAVSYRQAKLMAIGAAELDAERQIASVLSGALVTSKRKLEQYVQTEYLVEEKIQSLVRGAKVVAVRPLEGGNVEVDMELSLKSIKKKPAEEEQQIAEASEANQSVLIPSRKQGWRISDYYAPERTGLVTSPYTGLIINAQNLNFVPSIIPDIKDEDGKSYLSLIKAGLGEGVTQLSGPPITYVNDLEQAMELERVGDYPLVVDALATGNGLTSELTISKKDLKRIAASQDIGSLFREGRIVVVLDTDDTVVN